MNPPRRHTHPEPNRLTFGCPGCVAVADEARWTNAPIRVITWRAVVPRHIATHNGKPIEWRFTTRSRIPDGLNWRGDDEIDYGRFDVGAEMSEAMPRLDARTAMDAISTADIYIVAVDPLPTPPTDQPDLFGATA